MARVATAGLERGTMIRIQMPSSESPSILAASISSLGMPILINYNSNHKAANETRGLIEERGGKAELLPFDVSNESDVVSAIQKWEDEHPNDYISILVNNAGIRRDDMMFMMSDEDWHQVINTTLDGFFFLTRRLLKHMLPRNRGGRIINIASLSGLKGMPGQTNYSAAKAALIGATKALAIEVAPRNVTVNVLLISSDAKPSPMQF